MDRIFRMDLPLSALVENEDNPNEMGSREFDLLVDNLQLVGFTDPVLVWPYDLEAFKQVIEFAQAGGGEMKPEMVGKLQFRIIGGHHRCQGAQYLQMETVPCTIIMDPDFDEEAADAQLLRHNAIHGKLNPQKFVKLYEKYSTKYPQDVIQDLFGFADDSEFQKLIAQAEAGLPKELKKKFKEASAEIKTIDDLTKVLQHLFSTYGDTMEHGYMIIDQGGKNSIWLRVSQKTYDAVLLMGDASIQADVTMDNLVGEMLQSIARGDYPDIVKAALDKCPKANIPAGLAVMPTEDALEKVEQLNGT